jgi:DNA-binding NtrC family response regulator
MARTGRILVVDDEVNARTALAELLRDEGYDVETAADAFKALGKYETFSPHVVVTDLKMPGMDGIELVQKIRASEDPAAVVVMTAFGAVASAVEAMRAGAAEYLTKPLNFDELLVVLGKVFEQQELRRETRQLRQRVRDRVAPNNIVGDSPPMQRVFEIVDQVAPSRATVLITGESGTGKELVANALHQRSPRCSGPFIKLHCAALAESLLESELFGHERGSFTGAMARKDGRFQLADGGTLFLDEIGEISPSIQVKLLRFLQEHEFERVGGTQTIRVDVRVIAATNRNLTEEVAKGRFREDLYYRLNVVALEMPPLRERRSDIPALAKFFLDRYVKDNGKAIDGFAPETLELLAAYDWPGNVREPSPSTIASRMRGKRRSPRTTVVCSARSARRSSIAAWSRPSSYVTSSFVFARVPSGRGARNSSFASPASGASRWPSAKPSAPGGTSTIDPSSVP